MASPISFHQRPSLHLRKQFRYPHTRANCSSIPAALLVRDRDNLIFFAIFTPSTTLSNSSIGIEPGPRAADLALIEDGAGSGRIALSVGIFQNNVWRLPTEFKRDLFSCRPRSSLPTSVEPVNATLSNRDGQRVQLAVSP
jgi:hypothetical protein